MREYDDKFDVTGFNRAQLDLSNLNELRRKLRLENFDVLINAAAFTNVDLCETQREDAFRINAEAPGVLAEICRDKNARLIHFSTDYVFDGEKREPYTEEDEARPISVYGESKRAGEKFVLETSDRHLVMRVSWVFGPDRPSFIDAVVKRAREQEPIHGEPPSGQTGPPPKSTQGESASVTVTSALACAPPGGLSVACSRQLKCCRRFSSEMSKAAFCISLTPANAVGGNMRNGRSIAARAKELR